MRAFRTLLGGTDMLAYLAMMAPRLVELRRVLKESGSIYPHCDPTASHYLKLLMDAIFGTRISETKSFGGDPSEGAAFTRFGCATRTSIFFTQSPQADMEPDYIPITTRSAAQTDSLTSMPDGRRISS